MNPPKKGRHPAKELFGIRLSYQQQDILNILVNAYPRRIHKDALIQMLHSAKADGGPMWAETSLRVQIMHMRKKLLPFGWEIPHNKTGRDAGDRCFYTVAPLAGVVRAVANNDGWSTADEHYAYVRMPYVSCIDGANDNDARVAA